MISKFLVKTLENSLTACVFSHLLHLPAELFWRILRGACRAELPAFPGEPEIIDPWPKWSAAGSSNANYVEPDFFFRFPGLDLIVEAKRWDRNQQDETQWKNQVIAFANEHGDGNGRELRLIAVGGLHTFRPTTLVVPVSSPGTKSAPEGQTFSLTCVVQMCQWTGILQECQRLDAALEKETAPTTQVLAHRRILEDLIEFFAAHGYQTGRWFGKIVGTLPRLRDSTFRHHVLFQKLGSEVALS